MEEFDWRSFALCGEIKYEDDDPFFAEGYGATYSVARTYCSVCPVVIDCLIEGLFDEENLGMWGCMSPNERTEVRNKMEEGYTLMRAAESVWAKERKKESGMLVPPKKVWKDWDA